MMKVNELMGHKRSELMGMAASLGVDVNIKMSADDLRKAIEAITEGVLPERPTQGPAPDIEDVVPKEFEPHPAKSVQEERAAQAKQTYVVGDVGVPDAVATPEMVSEHTRNHRLRGMEILHIDAQTWHFRLGSKEDSGTMHQPLRRIIRCADALMAKVNTPENVV